MILLVADIHTYYGESYILKGLSLKVGMGSVVAIVGRNGMGKTTTMRSIMGFTPPRRGKIYFNEEDITHLESYKIFQKGLSLVPQGRRLFPSLTVKENLMLAVRKTAKEKIWDVEKVLGLFPVLRPRLSLKANQLSGGEQQMLAVGRALIPNPDLILMDEPSEGLAPLVIKGIGDTILHLKKQSFGILLSEQNIPLALGLADVVYVVNKGVMVFEGTPGQLLENTEVEREFLAV